MEPEFTLVGGILRFRSMASLIGRTLGEGANVPPGDMPQYAAAIGAAVMARRRALAGPRVHGAAQGAR
jgi:activator of 2-hydroxyglutaryl-CoA dehydratase